MGACSYAVGFRAYSSVNPASVSAFLVGHIVIFLQEFKICPHFLFFVIITQSCAGVLAAGRRQKANSSCCWTVCRPSTPQTPAFWENHDKILCYTLSIKRLVWCVHKQSNLPAGAKRGHDDHSSLCRAEKAALPTILAVLAGEAADRWIYAP